MSERSSEAIWDEAVQRVHRAFCEPDHELVGEWDRSMAAALRRNGYAIVPNLEKLLGPKRPPVEGPAGEFVAGWNDCRDFILRKVAEP